MKKVSVFFICFAVVIALFSVNNVSKSFSFENYLVQISEVADNRPDMPSTEKINKVVLEYGNYDDDSKWYEVLKSVWITLKLIYECIVFAVQFLIYIFEMIVYVIKIVIACTYNLLVW